MRYLVDTHILIWYMAGDSQLSPKYVQLLEEPANQLYVSQATLWEMSIKLSIKKLSLVIAFDQLPVFLQTNGFQLLPFAFEHFSKLIDMPFHHNDPFDRIMIAQAQEEQLTVLSVDKQFSKYPIALV